MEVSLHKSPPLMESFMPSKKNEELILTNPSVGLYYPFILKYISCTEMRNIIMSTHPVSGS
jgi:hypothetical protein